MALTHIKDPQRKAREGGLLILDHQGRRDRFVHKQQLGQMAVKFQPSQAIFRHNSRYQDETQHHGQNQIKEIVPGIDGSNPNGKGKE